MIKEMTFQFKSFGVKQEKSAMKIGTDSVLLGCLCDIGNAQSILDIGTGTGLLALMMAQKSTANIDAIELDEVAFVEAKENFETSSWFDRINIKHGDVRLNKFDYQFDIIISNPPYYQLGKSYSIEDEQRLQARHDKDLPFSDLCNVVFSLLKTEGVFWLILPKEESMLFDEEATKMGLYLQESIDVKPKATKKVNRVIMKWGKLNTQIITKEFIIYNEDGSATVDYIHLTKDFYLWKQLDTSL